MHPRSLAFAVIAALTVAACGGGGGGDADPSSGAPAQPPAPSGSTKTTPGVWSGTTTSTTAGVMNFFGLTDPAGNSVWMATDGRVWTGQLPTTGTHLATSMSGYMYPGRQFPDGANHGNWSMSGTLAQGSWSGQLSGNGDTATYNFSLHPGYDRPASTTLLAGTYTRTTSIGYTVTLSFTADGQLTGTDSRGCVFNGTVSIPEPAHNIYDVHADVSSCGVLDGTYQGHGTLLDATVMQDWTRSMGCFQYGAGGWSGGGGMMGGGGMTGGGMGRWWPNTGTNTVPTGSGNLFLFAMTDGRHAIMDALAR